MTANKCLSVMETAKSLGVCRQKVYELIHKGDLPCIRIGRRYVIPKSAFEQWLKKQCN
ncbi:MAG: helix-turn-helix domain-containing protein [Clostridium sp.]|nr:helix-turn-helix domain-containing protein [Clostridium sp.]